MKTLTKIESRLTKRGYIDVRELRNHVQVLRPDGFMVFLDKVRRNDPDARHLLTLNKIRLSASPDAVALAVGMFRGYQIARNYAKSYGLDSDVLKRFQMLLPPGEM